MTAEQLAELLEKYNAAREAMALAVASRTNRRRPDLRLRAEALADLRDRQFLMYACKLSKVSDAT